MIEILTVKQSQPQNYRINVNNCIVHEKSLFGGYAEVEALFVKFNKYECNVHTIDIKRVCTTVKKR